MWWLSSAGIQSTEPTTSWFTRALGAPNVGNGAVCLVHPTCGPTQDDGETCVLTTRPALSALDKHVLDYPYTHTHTHTHTRGVPAKFSKDLLMPCDRDSCFRGLDGAETVRAGRDRDRDREGWGGVEREFVCDRDRQGDRVAGRRRMGWPRG